jgi:hypothetical protein
MTPRVGKPLVANSGAWSNSPTGFAYQWYRAGAAISGATYPSYAPVFADVGNMLTIAVTARNGMGPSASAMSAATSAVMA